MSDPVWPPVWRVLRAIRAHDERLDDRLAAAHLPGRERGAPLSPLEISGDITPSVAAAIHLRVLDAAVSEWHASYLRIVRFHQASGHLRAPSGSFESYWLAEQRRWYRVGALAADRVRRLEDLGIVWDPRVDAWENRLDDARKFTAEFGHLNPPRDHPVAKFLVHVRAARREGKLPPDRISALDELGIAWDPGSETSDQSFNEGLAAAAGFFEEHGHLRVPDNYETPGYEGNLHQWAAYLRARWLAGKVTGERRVDLARVGMEQRAAMSNGMEQRAAMSNKEASWWESHDQIAAHWRAAGNLMFPTGSQESKWLVYQRQRRRAGKMPDSQIAALDALGMQWEPPRGGSAARR